MSVEESGRHLYQVRLSERAAWQGATLAALFNAVGMLIEFLIIRQTPGVPTRASVISAFVALILFILLLVWRKTPSVPWASFAYSLTTVNVLTVLLSNNLRFAISEMNWVPFQESKLGCLVAALVAPGFWVGLLSILAYCLSAVLQVEFVFPPGIRAEAAHAEPWPTIAFGLGGVLALVYRFRRAQLEQEVARIHAQNSAIHRLTCIFLNIRDSMNTPLQVIEFSVELLRNSDEPAGRLLDRIDRSLHSLREINSMMIRHEKELQSNVRHGSM